MAYKIFNPQVKLFLSVILLSILIYYNNMSAQKTKQCNKGCGTLIYFDEQHKSEKGRWVPLEADTNKPHECPNSDYNSGGGGGGQQSSTANKRISDLEERVTALEEKQ